MSDTLLTPARVARILRVNEEVIVRMIARGRAAKGELRGSRVDGAWMISESDLIAFAGVDGGAREGDVMLLEEVAALAGETLAFTRTAIKIEALSAFHVGKEVRVHRANAEKFKAACEAKRAREAAVTTRAVVPRALAHPKPSMGTARPAPHVVDDAGAAEVKPMAHTPQHVASMFNVSVRVIQDLAAQAKKPGKPKLYGLKIGKQWRFTDVQIAKYIADLEREARGESIE